MKLKRGFRGIVIALVLILCTNAAEDKVTTEAAGRKFSAFCYESGESSLLA